MAPEAGRVLLVVAGLLLAIPRHAHAQDFHAVPPAVMHAVSGGTWRLGPVRGHHRLLIIGGDPARRGPRLIIQWIEETADSSRTYVRQTQPIHAIAAPWILGVPQFVEGANGSVRVKLTGTNSTTHCIGIWDIVLGPPGQYGVQPDRLATPACQHE